MFKTLEEANEWKLQHEKEFNDLKTAHEGLKTKLADTEKQVIEKASEIDRLKIKNYEYMEQISVSKENLPKDDDNSNPEEFNFNEFIKNV